MSERAMQAGDWAVRTEWRVEVVRVEKVSAQTFTFKHHPAGRSCRAYLNRVDFFSPDEALARRVAAQLDSARGECRRREQAARKWLVERTAEIIAAAKPAPEQSA